MRRKLKRGTMWTIIIFVLSRSILRSAFTVLDYLQARCLRSIGMLRLTHGLLLIHSFAQIDGLRGSGRRNND